MNESIADCLAILRMRDEWMRKTIDYEIFINTLVKDMEFIGFPKISITSRLSNIENCYFNYGPADDFWKVSFWEKVVIKIKTHCRYYLEI